MKLRAEAQALAQAQRMEAVAQLTGGLAHDINNMLAVVAGNLDLAMPRIEDDKVRQFLARARQGVDMGTKLNRQLLTFARQRKLDPVRFNLNQHVAEISKLLEGALGQQTTLSMELASDPSTVMVDPGEIDNALLNLAINSRDAMPSGGSLKIETMTLRWMPVRRHAYRMPMRASLCAFPSATRGMAWHRRCSAGRSSRSSRPRSSTKVRGWA
jgi:signal transduction histidine kinase